MKIINIRDIRYTEYFFYNNYGDQIKNKSIQESRDLALSKKNIDYKINTDILIVGDDNCKNFLYAGCIWRYKKISWF